VAASAAPSASGARHYQEQAINPTRSIGGDDERSLTMPLVGGGPFALGAVLGTCSKSGERLES